MKTDLNLMVLFSLCWLIGFTACGKKEVRVVLNKPENKEVIKDCDYVSLSWDIENPRKTETYDCIFILNGKEYKETFGTQYDKIIHYETYLMTDLEMDLKDSFNLWFGKPVVWMVRVKSSGGKVYKSEIRTVFFKCENLRPEIRIDAPKCDLCVLLEGNVTFRWHILNAKPGVTYNSTVLFDKGVNPFDGRIETSASAGEKTELTRFMSARRWQEGFEWGVVVQGSDENNYESEIQKVKSIIKK